MTIERLSFPKHLGMKNGLEIPTDPKFNVNNFLAETMARYVESIHTLQPGEYDLTPEVWTTNTSYHNLVVFDEGTGV